MKKCPCEECILLAICRNKSLIVLFDDCSLLKEFLPSPYAIGKEREEKMPLIESILHPTLWYTFITYYGLKEPQPRDLFVRIKDGPLL